MFANKISFCNKNPFCKNSLKFNNQKQPPEVFCKKAVLKNFATLKKNTYAEVSFNKVASLQPASLSKKTPAQVYLCKFCKKNLGHLYYRTSPGDYF